MKLPFPRLPKGPLPGECRNKDPGANLKVGDEWHPNVRKGQWNGAVKKGEVLNPYGCLGKWRGKYRLGKREGSRDKSMAKKRARLEAKVAVILEARDLQEIARVNAKGAMEALVAIVNSKHAPEASRIAAAQVILDRGYGKASQTTFSANVSDGKTSEITADELEQRVNRALRRVEELTGRAPKAPKGKNKSLNVRKCH